MPRIALSAGHHNLTGGHQLEIELVGPITHELAECCRERGFDVRVITPGDGLGTFRGGLRKVAQTVVNWAQDGWRADVFIEIHAEDNGGGDNGRGCFTIFPDLNGDTDVIVRDELGPKIARAIRDATGIPLRGNGRMSEQKTHVFTTHQARLGIFEVTAGLKAHCRRMIVEVGSFAAPSDLAIMRRSNFAPKTGRAIADALADFFQLPDPGESLQWYRVVVDTARTREGPGRDFPIALQGEALLHRDDVFAADKVVRGAPVNGNALWVHRADEIGFVSMTLLEEAR